MKLRIDYRKWLLLAVLAFILIFHDILIASLLPFILAFVLAAMIEPIVTVFEGKLRLPRGASVMITLVSLIVVAGYLISVVLAKVAAELVDLAGRLPAYQRELVLLADELLTRLNELYEYLPGQVNTYLQNTIDDVSRNAVVLAGDLIDKALRTITGLPALLIILIITLLATYFFSKDREQMTDTLLRLAPRRWQLPLRDAQEKILVDLIGFLKAQALIFLVTSAVAAAGLYWIGTRFWMILALTLGILDVIPVMGPGLILFPWMGLSLALEQPHQAVQLFLLFIVILAIRQTAQAKVLGDSIGVHPLAMLVAIYGGIVIFGVRGLLLGPLLVIIGKALWNAGLIPRPSTEAAPSEPGGDEG